jgi:hypothetical protein
MIFPGCTVGEGVADFTISNRGAEVTVLKVVARVGVTTWLLETDTVFVIKVPSARGEVTVT